MPARYPVFRLLAAVVVLGAVRGSVTSAIAGANQAGQDWIDLLADTPGWRRESPAAAKFPLVADSPWRYDPSAGVLHCAATGVYELYYYDRICGDGVLRAEWRYLPVPGAAEKNDSGVMFRVSSDRRLKLQAQLAGRGLGRIAGDQLRAGERVHVGFGERSPGLARPVGEWNVLEIVFHQRTVRLRVNGRLTASADDLDSPPGQIGLQAEYWPVEFRRVQFLPK